MALLLAPLPPNSSSRLSSSSFSFFRSSFNGEFPLKCFDLKKENRCSSIKKLTYLSCRSSWEELAGVLIFSAIPFTAVKAISNSSVGKMLRKRMLETKNSSVANSSKFKAMTEKARKESFWYGEERPRWLGPIPFGYPAHLSGELPGDYGFDVAGLSKDPVALQKYFNFEILHARWAMLASLGAVIPELLNLSGAIRLIEPVWWRVGYAKLQGDTLDYLGIPGLHIAGGQGVVVIAICQALLMVTTLSKAFMVPQPLKPLSFSYTSNGQTLSNQPFGEIMVGPEYARYCGIEALEPLGIYLPGDINYPGGTVFDPLGLSRDPVAFEELKVKEIKNGRLAMVAWLGFYLQAAVTGKGPIQNLTEHISDPFHNNLLSM